MVVLFGAATTPEAVLAKVEAKVVADGVFPSQSVYASLAPDEDVKVTTPADRFCVLKPTSATVRAGDVTGGGRDLVTVDSRWEAAVWCRFEADLTGQNAAYIKNATLGVLSKFRALLRSLEQFAPLNDSGACVLAEPMRLVSFDLAPKRVKDGWGRLSSVWAVSYVMDLSQ